jgi:hypothetical protein
MLDDQLLQEFMLTFYGYGNYKGDYWFVGMEEGGGNSLEGIARKLATWESRGKRELEDLVGEPGTTGVSRYFRENPPIQRTWGGLIRILFSIEGQEATRGQIRRYQRDSLARSGGNTCLLELLPLPSPSIGHWLYGQHSRLPYLKSRDIYKQTCIPGRIATLKKRIEKHKPKVVVFYSLGYRPYWQQIAGVDFSPTETDGVYIGQNEHTVFAITKHPAAKGITNEYFRRVGEVIASKLLRSDERGER